MFLSFIVPVYNVEQYLEECLKSLLIQDIEDYEIICVNDGSTDYSLDILKKYAEKIIIIDQENKGVCEARNAGILAAKGDYIWFVDSDDFITHNILSEVKGILSEKLCDKLDIGLYHINGNFNESEKKAYIEKKLKANLYSHNVNVYASILRREFLMEHHILFHYPDISYGEDSLFMCEFNSFNPLMESFSGVCYIYRMRPNSLSVNNSYGRKIKKIESLMKALPIFEKFYLEVHENIHIFADKLMSNLWLELYLISSLTEKEENLYLNQLKSKKLFPYKRVRECTLTKSYMTSRTDMKGKIFDFLYLHSHTVIGYTCLKAYHRLRHY